MVNFAKGGDQVEADHIALAVDDTEGVPLPWLSIALFTLSLQAFCGECCRGRDLRCGGL